MTERIKTFFSFHRIAVAASLGVGLFIVAPQLAFIQEAGSSYQGLYLMHTDAEFHYLARMQDASEGHLGNPFIVEYRDTSPSGIVGYAEAFLALPALLFPIPIPTLNLWYKGFLPAILAFLIYLFVFRLTASRAWSLVAAIAIVLGDTTFNVGTVRAMLESDFMYQQFLVFSRAVNPVFSSIVFFAFLHVLLSVFTRPSRTGYGILGVLFGIAWYLYFYLATFLLALLAVWVCSMFFTKRFREARLGVGATLAGLVLGVPVLRELALIAQSSYFDVLTQSVDLLKTHAIGTHLPTLLVLALFVVFWFRRPTYQYGFVLAMFFGACALALNQQVFTGRSLQSGHYITYFCIPISLITLVVLLRESAPQFSRHFTRFLQISVVCYAVLAASFIQYSSYRHWAPIVQGDQYVVEAFAWLTRQVPAHSVVMANERLSELIPVYTSNYVMWENHAKYYLVSPERQAFTPQNALASKDFCGFVRQHRVDYLMWDTRRDPEWQTEAHKCLTPLADINNVHIYRISL